MTSKTPTITIFTADTGHTSIAQAISDTLDSLYQVKVTNVSVPGFSLYYPFYRYFPQLSGIGFKASQRKMVFQTFQKILGDSYRLKIAETIAKDRSDMVISTYYAANPNIEAIVGHTKIPYLNIITDPRTISAFLPSPHAVNLVFDQTAYDYCHDHLHIPAKNLSISGWFVRPEYQPAKVEPLRKKLKVPLKRLTFMIAAGSEGTNLVLKIVPTLLQTKVPLTLFVACGHNQRLYDLIQNLYRANRLLNSHSPIKIIPLRFTDQLYRYMQASDLIIGKAGPNLLFESVACHVPFFAITHISGQEDGNLDLIKEYNLGFVEENPLKANRLLKSIINHPSILSDFAKPLKSMADHNRQAETILLKVVTDLIGVAKPN